MVSEVIWTTRATDDYQAADPTPAPDAAIDHFLQLAKIFPELGSRVQWADRVRRGLIARSRIYGIFHAVHGERLFVLALLDLRQDQNTIESLVRGRLPKG